MPACQQPAQRARGPAEENLARAAQEPGAEEGQRRRCGAIRQQPGDDSNQRERDRQPEQCARDKPDRPSRRSRRPKPVAAMPVADGLEHHRYDDEACEQQSREDRGAVAIKRQRVFAGRVVVQEEGERLGIRIPDVGDCSRQQERAHGLLRRVRDKDIGSVFVFRRCDAAVSASPRASGSAAGRNRRSTARRGARCSRSRGQGIRL